MASGPDSGYGGSQYGSSVSAQRPEVVPVPNHGQVEGVSSERNLAVNQDTGEVLDDDTGEVVTTVTTITTTTTTTRTRKGRGPGSSPAPPSSQATSSSSGGSYFAGTPSNNSSSSTSGSQVPQAAQSPPSEYTIPEQEQAPAFAYDKAGHNAQSGQQRTVPNLVVNDRPVSPRLGQNFSYPSRTTVGHESVESDAGAGSPPISVPEALPARRTTGMGPHAALRSDSAVGSNGAVPASSNGGGAANDGGSATGTNAGARPNAAPSGSRWEALEELKAAGKLAAPEAKSMLKGLEAFAIGMHAVGKKLEPTFDEFDRRQAEKYAAQQRRSRSANPSTTTARPEHPARAQQQSSILPFSSKQEKQQRQQQSQTQASQTRSSQSSRSKKERQRSRSEDRTWGVTDDSPAYQPQRRFRDASPDHPGLKPTASTTSPKIRRVRSITPPPDSHIQRVANGGGSVWAQPHAPPDPMYHSDDGANGGGGGHGINQTKPLRDSEDSARIGAEGKKGKEKEREKGHGFFHRLKGKAA